LNAEGDPRSAIERVFREEAGRLTASLVRLLGDFDLAEEMVAEAVVEALIHWPTEGIPERPGAWLLTTARRKGIDRLRRDQRYSAKLAQVAGLPESAERQPDDRLRLIFTCCHPALERDTQVALTLRAVVGLTTAEIARAFLVPEATLAKRLTRAKHKIVVAGIPYRTPEQNELRERLAEVLQVIYLIFNEGYLSTAGDRVMRRELADDAEWLAGMLVHWLPEEPEPLGLLALVRLHLARWPARLSSEGRIVLLADQDRSRWDHARIRSAAALLSRAAAFHRVGQYQIEAAIAAVHAEAPSWEETDWVQLVALYDMLERVAPSPVVVLNRAVIIAEVQGPSAGLAEVEKVEGALAHYYLFHAVRADLLRRLGRAEDARDEDRKALEATTNTGERSLLTERLVDQAASTCSPSSHARPTTGELRS
jgi:RNA polymerase sigma-70 factor (ECF subfamily)